jgi:septum formation protein
MNKNFLYLASQSKSRQSLLELADIPFKLISHSSDECVVDKGGSFEEYVLSIAREKMDKIVYPSKEEIEKNKEYFFLTSDTLVKTLMTCEVFGKPTSREDAKRMLRSLRQQEALVATACCLEKKIFNGKSWETLDKNHFVVTARIEYCVDEEWIEIYLQKVPIALSIASSATVEGYGHNFVKSIRGSYSAALGLPVFELRHALKNMNFWK